MAEDLFHVLENAEMPIPIQSAGNLGEIRNGELQLLQLTLQDKPSSPIYVVRLLKKRCTPSGWIDVGYEDVGHWEDKGNAQAIYEQWKTTHAIMKQMESGKVLPTPKTVVNLESIPLVDIASDGKIRLIEDGRGRIPAPRLTIEGSRAAFRPKPLNLYLGTRVVDVDETGLSSISEIEQILSAMREDFITLYDSSKLDAKSNTYPIIEKISFERALRGEFSPPLKQIADGPTLQARSMHLINRLIFPARKGELGTPDGKTRAIEIVNKFRAQIGYKSSSPLIVKPFLEGEMELLPVAVSVTDGKPQMPAELSTFFNDAFKGYIVPPSLRAAVERICIAYGIRGIADPMYIANVIGYELGIGDGKGNFPRKTIIQLRRDAEIGSKYHLATSVGKELQPSLEEYAGMQAPIARQIANIRSEAVEEKAFKRKKSPLQENMDSSINFGHFKRGLDEWTLSNENYRDVILTGEKMQLVLMSLEPEEAIGNEIHENVEQFFRIVAGTALVVLNELKKDEKVYEIPADHYFLIPAGTWHNVKNKSKTEQLKLYTLYSPPNHPPTRVQATNPNITPEKVAEKKRSQAIKSLSLSQIIEQYGNSEVKKVFEKVQAGHKLDENESEIYFSGIKEAIKRQKEEIKQPTKKGAAKTPKKGAKRARKQVKDAVGVPNDIIIILESGKQFKFTTTEFEGLQKFGEPILKSAREIRPLNPKGEKYLTKLLVEKKLPKKIAEQLTDM